VIIMLTSSWGREGAARSRELGISAYLNKPIRRPDLLRAVRMALGSQSQAEDKGDLQVSESVSSSQKSLRILLAEDNAVNQALAVHMLQKKGHDIVVASNGREVIEHLGKQNFDLILMDVQMPEVDGFEAARIIREQEKISGEHIPIIAMTAHAMVGDRERCLDAGMDNYISKPLHRKELLSIIDTSMSTVNRTV
jgi:CheY-like chemotaxis protein